MIKYPSIGQYRHAISNVKQRAQYRGKDENGSPIYDKSAPLPKIKYRGTVKIHGTNAGVVKDYEKHCLIFQSRERELSLETDNAGFALAMSQPYVKLYLNSIADSVTVEEPAKKVAIFGEWAGAGIQKGVAVSALPKMFVIFGIKKIIEVDGEDVGVWLDISNMNLSEPEHSIYSIFDFPSYEIEIDFENPELAQNEMIRITEEIEKECPVGKRFGVSGIGEGVVWTPVDDVWRSSDFMFKTKGEKHSVTKVKTLAPVDVEKITAMKDFVSSVVTEARLEQGLDNLVREQQKPFEMSSLGDFIRWIISDVIKEETDTIVANQLDAKKLGGPIAEVARKWYITQFNERDNA